MSELAFVSSPLDRNANNRTNTEFVQARKADSNSKFLQLSGDQVRLENNKLYTRNEGQNETAIYLGDDSNGQSWFATRVEPSDHFKPLRGIMIEGQISQTEVSILAQARSILHWHEKHSFCANCGAQSLMMDAGYRRHCAACSTDHFPRTDPVVIMAVCHQDKILLGRQAAWGVGMFSALAGFMEPGETIEQAVAREVREEVGIEIGKVRYVTTQPWPFPSSLMIGMIAEATTTDIIIDPKELEQARWFTKNEVRQMQQGTHPEGLTASHPYAIAHYIISETIK